MSEPTHAPEASVLRLSRYHCFLGELNRSGETRRIRSREMAEELGVSEETVRRDLSYVDHDGRPGAGYDPVALHEALQEFLELTSLHPFVAVGNADILRGLTVTFPATAYGLRPIAYFSDRREDLGALVDGIEVRDLSEVPTSAGVLGATIALVACEPDSVERTLGALDAAGVTGVVMLTPVLRPRHPEGMSVTYFRIPCTLKSLACADPPSCGAPSKAQAPCQHSGSC